MGLCPTMAPPTPFVQRPSFARRINQLPARKNWIDCPVEPGRDRLLARAPVRCTGRLAPTVVAHRALRNPQQPRDVAVRTLSARQALDRHPILPAELGHPPPPSARTETEPCQGASRSGRCDASISVNRRFPVRTARYGRMLGEAQRRLQAGRLPRERIWPARDNDNLSTPWTARGTRQPAVVVQRRELRSPAAVVFAPQAA